ncbi:MAG: Maf-like protein [Fuerstiella sp.]|nr:Maf-like protein [Fuerstiella sp.]MCP4787129.1 Maf-like protein [Fuerstiella sp.]MCP4859159.1 Maf-like protein [Fuerstiella sp.]
MSVVLGSRSPRRCELLQSVLGGVDLQVVPPASDDEPGFDGLHAAEQFETRLREIVELKHADVSKQLSASQTNNVIICADTIVVAWNADQESIVLGKPPVDSWQQTVRHWFREYYSGRYHEVWTCFRITQGDQFRESIVKTKVLFCALDDWLIDWYVSTDESVGKAGGYGIQGRASMLVEAVEGSFTNVVGLPMMEVTRSLRDFSVLKE